MRAPACQAHQHSQTTCASLCTRLCLCTHARAAVHTCTCTRFQPLRSLSPTPYAPRAPIPHSGTGRPFPLGGGSGDGSPALTGWPRAGISQAPGGGRGASTTPGTHREAPGRVHLDHAAQQALAVGWDEVRHVENTPLHLLQQLPQVVVVKGQSPLPAGTGVTSGGAEAGGGQHHGREGGRAGGSPPTGRKGSRRSSTRPPCGRHTSPPAKEDQL